MENSATRISTHEKDAQTSKSSDPREWLVRRWLRQILVGRLTVEFPSGTCMVFEGKQPGPHGVVQISDMRLITRLILSGDIGFAEGYMAEEWDTPDLTSLLKVGALNEEALEQATGPSLIMTTINRLRHAFRANTPKGSRRNIAAHYDLGNEFYGQWLDETMSYSSAVFAEQDEPMVVAQRRKYLRLAEQLDLQPGDRVLEIGCGWGGFAEIAAAEFDCYVVGLTLSVEQAAYARDRMAQAGLSDKVDIRVEDYRHTDGQFDKIVSIEMFEAVGEKYWPAYMDVLNSRLSSGGKIALQIITINDAKFEYYRSNPDFIQQYIFPGGMLPGFIAFKNAATTAELAIKDAFTFGNSYAETLRRWDRDFQKNWPAIEPLGFDERFRRMWRYYLCYCEAGFDLGVVDVVHFLIERK